MMNNHNTLYKLHVNYFYKTPDKIKASVDDGSWNDANKVLQLRDNYVRVFYKIAALSGKFYGA